jgi:DnaK suppressor protein
MEQQTNDARRAGLEEEREHLVEQLSQLQSDAYDANFADHAQVAAEQGEAHALADVLRDRLSQVETALVRLDEGTYGSCEKCGGAISDARLEALPSTTTCITHA